MKKLLIVLVLFALVFATGCLPSWLPGIGSDDPVPEPEPEVVVNAVLADVEVDTYDTDEVVIVGGEVLVPAVVWSIENISEEHIYDYSLTFTVSYAEGVKTNWEEVVSGVNLYPGDVDFGELILPVVVSMYPATLITVLATY